MSGSQYVSTDQQAEHGGSIADQEKRIAAWCKSNGYELVAT
jgi:DNA invertase Pin-like site-specific DNA recombinase